MKGHLKKSIKEVNRIPSIEKLTKKEITNKQAAERLELSIRQVIRLSSTHFVTHSF